MFKIKNIFTIFLSLLVGHYLLIKPEISLILGFLLLFLIIKNKDKNKKMILIVIILFVFSIVRVFVLKLSIFTHVGVVVSSKDNYFIYSNGLSKFFVYNKNNKLEVMDIIYIDGVIENYNFTNYEGQFDFNSFLENKLIYKEINNFQIDVLIKSPIRINKIYENYINKYNEEGKIVISELIFNKSYSPTYSDFINQNSLIYLLSVSSLHIYLLSNLLKKILQTKLSSKITETINVIFLYLIFVLSGYKVGILRILIINILNNINLRKKYEWLYLDRVIISLMVIILIDPSYLFSIGFIYNFFLPFYLVLITDAVSTFKKKYQEIVRSVFIYLLIGLLSIIINESFSFLSIILIPLFTFIVMVLFILGLLSFLLPFERLVSFISRGLLFLLNNISNIKLNLYIERNIFFIVISIVLLVILILSLENKRKSYQRLISFGMFINLLFVNYPLNNKFQNNVYFINVGQGDSTLIVSKGVYVLVDTGGVIGNDLATKTLIPFLKKKNIYHLNYVFLTHQDYDHMGCFDSLRNNFKVLDYNKTNYFTNIVVGDISFTNLNPSANNYDNDDSLVLYFQINNLNYLLMGDVSKEIEKKIIKNNDKLNVDILKVGHHGSSTSTSKELIEATKPTIAVISCGRNNYYNHPSNEVINLLSYYQIEIRRTDIEGTIKI